MLQNLHILYVLVLISQAVSLNHTVGKVQPQENPLLKMQVTERPPAPFPHPHQDRRRADDVGEAAAYRYPQVRGKV